MQAFHRKMLEPAWFMMRQACDDFRLSLLTPREVRRPCSCPPGARSASLDLTD